MGLIANYQYIDDANLDSSAPCESMMRRRSFETIRVETRRI